MKRINYRISLDMFEVESQTTIKAKRGDTACSIYITLMENGKIYHIVDGCHAVFSGKKPDGNYLFNGETCRIEDNTIIYDFTKQTTPVEGIVECELILYKGEDKLTSPRFNLKVDSTVYNGEEIISTPEADALKELTDRAEDIVNQFDEGVIVGKEYVDNAIENQVSSIDLSMASNALKGSAKGSVVSIKDVSPLEHDIKVHADVKKQYVVTSLSKGDIAYSYEVKEAKGNVTVPQTYTPLNYSMDDVSTENGYNPNAFEIVALDEFTWKGFSAYFPPFVSAFSIGVVISGDEGYYTLRLVGTEGGNVSCEILNDKLYLQVDNSAIEEYEVGQNAEFKYIGCDGEEFSFNSIDLYNCISDGYSYTPQTKVKVLGKNFFDVSRVKNDSYGRVVNNQDGTLTITASTNSAVTTNGTPRILKEYAPDLIVGQQYKLSLTTQGTKAIYLRNDGASYSTSWRSDRVFTLTENDLNADVYWYGAGAGVPTTISNIQIELGTVATEYEPYQGELTTYNVNADGSVDGVRSIYPSMTFMPDTEGVTLDVEYNRDINKAFAELQTALISMGGNI